MAIYRYMDASLEHVSRQDIETLRDLAGDLDAPLIVFPYETGILPPPQTGFFIPVSEDFDEDAEMACRDEGLSEALIHLVRMARDAGCPLLRLDWDADVIAGLPVFE